jgi:hypothetical protein
VGFDLLGGKHVFSHDGKERLNISISEVILSHAQILNSPVAFKHSHQLLNGFSRKLVIANIKYFQSLVVAVSVLRLEHIADLFKVSITKSRSS